VTLRTPFRPTRPQLEAARQKTIPDVIAPGLDVLFCGINPGLYSAAVGCHFGRPGNRFWPVLFRSGFTDRLLSPFEQQELLRYGCGVTNLVRRASRAADELAVAELVRGGRALERKLRRYRPRALAVLGLGAYRTAFGARAAGVGRQDDILDGVQLWVLPNPSGLNAHYQADALVKEFAALRDGLRPRRADARAPARGRVR
jgi:TDG/mug DNA glycosylase family protein